jgi:hypothetical protein
VTSVDLVDDTFVVAPPAAVAARVSDPESWRAWWPDLELAVTRDRGVKGVQWTVTGALVGTAEVWLEPYADGTIVHFYLRADPTARGTRTTPASGTPRAAQAQRRQRARSWKRSVHALKDDLEAGRQPGLPPSGTTAAETPASGRRQDRG